jgi:large repetitive protein
LTATDVEGDPVYFDAFERGTVDYQLAVNNTTGLVTVTPPAGYVGPLEVLVGVRALNGSDTSDVWDSQIVKINVLAGELTLDLLAQSDSNIDNDNVTNVTNMTFRVGNTSVGALVQILHNGSVIGQGTATGSSIDITTNNLAALGDGTYSLTAVQTVAGVTSAPSSTLAVTLDTTPPVPLTSTPPTTASNGIEVVYDAQHPEEGTPGFGYSLSGAPAGAVINPVTGVMRWTPTVNQGGVNLFQVVAMDLAGNLRTQDLSIDVTVVEQKVLIELVVIDSQENPVTTISSGEDFWVFAYVQDIRTPAEGVFAAYMDILFDTTIVSSQASSLTDVIFGTKYQNGKSGFFATPGLIDEIGAFGPITPVGGGKELLFAIPFRADQAGQVTFRLDPSDSIGREVLVFGENEPVTWNAITLANATLTVSSGLVAVNDLFNVDEDSVNFPLNVLANDVNEIGGTVTISQVGTTSHGGVVTIGTNGQNLLYSPAANFFGEETFTYTITAGGLTSTASVTVQVAPVNDPPTAVNDTFTVDTGSQNNFLDVLANDLIAPDTNETLRIVSVGSTSHGGTVVIAPNGTHLLYTPPVGFSGNETFSYTIRDRAVGDPTGLQSTASVMMTVENVARPTARPDAATVQEDSTANSVLVLANDEPVVPGATLRVVSVTQSKFGGTVTIAAGGTHVLYTPAADFFGEDTFTYTVEEVDGERSTASVTMTVLNVNDPPTANDDTYQVSKGSATKTLNVLENDTIFPDVGETLTIVAVTQGSQGGTVTIAAGGQAVLYTPSANTSLPDTYTETFTYTISDGSDETDTATVTIQIRPYTARDIGGTVMYSASTLGIGGLAVNLQGVDNFNGPVAATSQTMGDGTYKFTDLAPGSYQLQTNSAPFLLQSNTVLTVQSGDEDGSSLNNNFNSIARNPATLSIMDFLARAPRQSSISPTNSVMIAAQAGGQQDWYSYQAGWQDYTQLQSQLSSDASQLTLTALHSSGQQYQGTVP